MPKRPMPNELPANDIAPAKAVKARGKAKPRTPDLSPSALLARLDEASEDWQEKAPHQFKWILETQKRQ